jgi:hypothetical protein
MLLVWRNREKINIQELRLRDNQVAEQREKKIKTFKNKRLRPI